MLVGNDPRVWLPSAYIQFVRFDGTDLIAPILDQKELSGRLDAMLRQAEEVADGAIGAHWSAVQQVGQEFRNLEATLQRRIAGDS